jgi:hypothetical protein
MVEKQRQTPEEKAKSEMTLRYLDSMLKKLGKETGRSMQDLERTLAKRKGTSKQKYFPNHSSAWIKERLRTKST